MLQKCGHTNQGMEIIKPIILYEPTSNVDCLFVRIFILLISLNILQVILNDNDTNYFLNYPKSNDLIDSLISLFFLHLLNKTWSKNVNQTNNLSLVSFKEIRCKGVGDACYLLSKPKI